MFWLVALASLPASASVDIVHRDGFDQRFGFQIQTPVVTVQPGQSASFCYYSHMPNTSTLGIRRWLSTLGPGIDRLIAYTTPTDRQPANTLTQTPCGLNTGEGLGSFIYITHNPQEDLVFPNNDGEGLPLAMEIVPATPVVLEMFVSNYTSDSITTSALLVAEAMDPSKPYSKSATYVAQRSDMSVPPNSTGFVVQNTCAVPTGAKFWWLSTRTHRFATSSAISDGASQISFTTDWEHPDIAEFPVPPFYSFVSSGLTYRCVYDNPTNTTIRAGDNEFSQEVCMAISYFFPAPTGSKVCIDGTGPL
ncbi:MAG: hypothetical protein ABIY56_01595 [Dokdonella sp.]